MIPFEKIAEKLGGWAHYFKPFYDSGGFEKIYTQLKEEGSTIKIVPEGKDLFKAFELCTTKELKTIWIGQDPYPMIKYGKVVADGMAFSCSHTKEEQPSLQMIYNGVEEDLYNGMNLKALREPDLTYWAKQGVLLLNSSLTTPEGNPGTHKELWHDFIWFFLQEVIEQYFQALPIVFMGKQAQEYKSLITNKHHVKCIEHPVAAGYGKKK